jgi:hypothetical protein
MMGKPTDEYTKRNKRLKQFFKRNGLWDSVRELEEEEEEEEEEFTREDWLELNDKDRDR